MSQRHKSKKKSKKANRGAAQRRNRFRLPGFSEFHLEDRTVPTDFSNLNPIMIPGTGSSGTASPYPSTITVSVPAGQVITNLQVLFNNLSHTSPDNIDAMLIAPGGAHIYLMSDCGGGAGQPISGVNLTISDTGIPFTDNQIVAGTYQPTNINQGDPDTIPGSPATPPVATMADFRALNPNGVWELRINDDTAPDTGLLSMGWTLRIDSRVNSAPVANNDSYTVNEDTTLNITAGGTPHGVLFNDTDADNDPLTAILVSSTTHGTLTFNPNGDGGFTYVPRANFNGTDTFTYRATDGIAISNLATVTITVNSINDVPVANNDTLTIQNGGPQTIHRAVLLGNDIDPDVTYRTTVFSQGFEGLATMHFSPAVNGGPGADGTDWGEPPTGWMRDNTTTPPPTPTTGAPEFFGWHALDIDSWISQQGDQSRSLFTRGGVGMHGTIMVSDGDAYDDFPPGLGTTHMNTLLVTPSIPLAGINVDSLTLEFDSSFRPEDPDPGNQVGKVEVSFNDGATWTTLQDLNFANSGGLPGSLQRVNEHLVLETHNQAAATAVKFRFGYLDAGNDWWWAIDNVKVTGDKTDPAQETIQIQSQPSQGTVSVDANGAVIYNPPTLSFTGSTSFTYRLFDGVATSNTATVALTVNANNVVPVAADDSFATTQGVAVATQYDRSLLANDSDPDLGGGNVGMKAVLVTGPAANQGTLVLRPDGTFTFTPLAAFFGNASFTYRVDDGSRVSNTATVTIAVVQTNTNPPVAVNDSYSVNNNGTLTVSAPGVLMNDSDPDGNPLTAVATTGPNTLVIGPNHGTLTFNADGSFVYVPRAFYNGADSFTYRAFDGVFFSNVATVNITVNAVNVPPRAVPDTFYTRTNMVLTVPAPGVLRNDQDDGPNTQLFLETFDSLTLVPWNTGTTGTGDGTDWTEALPTGWARDNTTTPPPSSGTAAGAEFFGWHAMDADSWAAQQGNQARNDFTRGGAGLHGTVLVADGDAYDDFFDIDGTHMNTLLITPSIPLGSITPNSLTLEFDSSFRPEDPPPLNQVGKVEVSYDNGTTWIPMLDLNTDNTTGGAGSRVRTNEHLTLDAFNPAGATTAKFRFGYLDAGNDWWWAVDNVRAAGRTANAGANMTAQIVTSPPASQGTLSLNANGGFTFTPANNFTGVASFTYRANDAVNNSAATTVSILVGPQAALQVNDGSPQHSRVTSLQVTFAGIATFATTQPASAFTLMQGTTAIPFKVTNVDYSTGATVVTLTNFTGALTQFGSLADGRYTLTALASQITINGQALDGDGNGTAGGDFAAQLYRYFGDATGDQRVDIADFGLFSTTYNLHTGDAGFLPYFDFNADGGIDIFDFGQFSFRMFTMLPP